MIPSICSKAAANISLASDIISCSVDLKEERRVRIIRKEPPKLWKTNETSDIQHI